MSDLSIDTTTGDLAIANGEVSLVTGAEAVRQDIASRLKTIKGEWFLDPRIGVPYFNNIFVKNPDRALVTRIFGELVRTTSGVKSLVDIDLSVDRTTRRASLSVTVELEPSIATGQFTFEYGPLIIEVE